MPTQDALIPITFAQGIDTKTDPKAVLQGSMLTVENGVFTKGAIIQKRYGAASLGNSVFNSGSVITQGAALNTYQNELLVFTGNRLYSRSETNNNLLDRGVSTSVQIANKQILGATNVDCLRTSSAINQNIGAYAWYDGTSIWACIIDEISGAKYATQRVSAGYTPTGAMQLFIAGNYIYLVFQAGGALNCFQLSVLNPTAFTFVSALVSDADTVKCFFDVVEFAGFAFLAYRTNASKIGVFAVVNGVVGSTSIGYPGVVTINESPDNCLSVFTDNTSLYVVWHNNTNGLRTQSLNTRLIGNFNILTLDATTSPTFNNATGYALNGALTVFAEAHSTIDVNQFIKTTTFSTAGAVTSSAAVFKRSVGLFAKAFVYNGQGYVPCVFYSQTQPTYFLFAGTGNRVAKFVVDEAGSYQIQSFLSRVNVSANAAQFVVANLNKVQIESATTLFFNRGVNRTTITFGANNAFAAAQLGANMHIIGGNLFNYDGANVTEHGFDVFPEGQSLSSSISTVSGSIGAGSNSNAGIWTYYFTYRWTDAQGQLHESAGSLPQQITLTGSTNAVTWTIPTLRVTDKLSGSIAVYRSAQNSAPVVPYLLTSLSGVFNDTTQDSVTYVDKATDASIASNAILYTVGASGVAAAGSPVDNDSPPACSAICTNKNRLWVVSSENPLRMFYSKQWVVTNGVEFNLGFFVDCDPFGGAITALASMQNQLIIFKQSSIFFLAGDGPDATGANNDYGVPQLVTSDVGCVNPASIVVTGEGIFFQSQKGIYLLNTGLQAPVYVGAAVEAYNAYTVTSATLLANSNQVRFTLSGGPTLVYDTYFNQWSTFVGLHKNLVDCAVYNGAYTMLSPAGALYRESTGYQDNGMNVPLTLETAWIKLDPRVLQGFQRVKKVHVLGTLGSTHTLFVQVAYNYDNSILQSMMFNTQNALNASTWGSDATWGSGSLWGSANSQNNGPCDQVYQWRSSLIYQKCEALKFKFYDTFSGSLGAGYSLNELLLTIGMKKGGFKLVGSKTI